MQNIEYFHYQGHRARFLHTSNPSKPSLVFLMGSLQEIESIEVFNRSLSKDFDYWAIEVPGSGNTDPLPPKYPVQFLADYFKHMTDQLIPYDFHLVACSYATGIALEYAKMRSARLNRMVLAGSMMDIPLSEWPTMLQLMRDCAFDTPAFANGFIDLLTVENPNIPRQNVIKKAAERKASRYKEENFWHFVFNTIRLMCYWPQELHTINTPTLVFTGEYDPYVKPSHSLELANALPNGELKLIPNCDHLFHIENPGFTSELIINYLHTHDQVVAA